MADDWGAMGQLFGSIGAVAWHAAALASNEQLSNGAKRQEKIAEDRYSIYYAIRSE